MIETIRWRENKIRILDQTLLPNSENYINLNSVDSLIDAIKKLKVRGAPALGIAGAMGMALGIQKITKLDSLSDIMKDLADRLKASRPTAVNLKWGIQRILDFVQSRVWELDNLKKSAIEEAENVLNEDIRMCQSLGKVGEALIPNNARILTHCNTGGLATGGYGTALGVIQCAHESGKKPFVYADETRPLLQGARLTTWELKQNGIEHALICDNMAGYLMQQKKVDCVIVGADRIAANGDTANKIGTYSLAVLCEKHRIPFYVAAPSSTVDSSTAQGKDIRIEERPPEEITTMFGYHIAPDNTPVYNPAFDVTPAELITAIVTEKQIFYGTKYAFTN